MTRFVGQGRSEVTLAEELVSVEEHLEGILRPSTRRRSCP
jgi:hypothetical protein